MYPRSLFKKIVLLLLITEHLVSSYSLFFCLFVLRQELSDLVIKMNPTDLGCLVDMVVQSCPSAMQEYDDQEHVSLSFLQADCFFCFFKEQFFFFPSKY